MKYASGLSEYRTDSGPYKPCTTPTRCARVATESVSYGRGLAAMYPVLRPRHAPADPAIRSAIAVAADLKRYLAIPCILANLVPPQSRKANRRPAPIIAAHIPRYWRQHAP